MVKRLSIFHLYRFEQAVANQANQAQFPIILVKIGHCNVISETPKLLNIYSTGGKTFENK